MLFYYRNFHSFWSKKRVDRLKREMDRQNDRIIKREREKGFRYREERGGESSIYDFICFLVCFKGFFDKQKDGVMTIEK